jgi:membrane carboxypeptidase/penicillin-binding protein
MLDLATAYGVIANQGHRVDLSPIKKITDYKHQSIYVNPCSDSADPPQSFQTAAGCSSDQVIKPVTAFFINDILSDPRARANTFGYHSQLSIAGHQVAVKTGTTNQLRDNWTIGYTDHLLVAVWVGNNDNTPMSGVASGITGATPIWHQLITKLLENQPPQQFHPLNNLIKVTICPLTQTKSCTACPNPATEYFLEGSEPQTACTKDQIDRLLNPPTDPLPRDQILEGSSTIQN